MAIINSYLNIRNSLRNITDIEFEKIIEQLADEISQVNIELTYTDDKLNEDWKKLVNWKNKVDYINSTERVGMKLCEHFFPNFYDIENNQGISYRSLWTKENLVKILRWNRKSHSTPYLSELKRGVYFCCGLTKNTMYRPQMAKMACLTYKPEIVLDPCAGWGGRMLGVVASGARYIAFEPNTTTYNNILKLAKFLNIENRIQIICDDARNMLKYNLPKVDMILTSPPYFDLEVYTHENTQSITNTSTYEMWVEDFLNDIMDKSTSLLNPNGVSCWNVGKVGKHNMNDDVLKFHIDNGFNKDRVLSVISSKRQTLQKPNSKKSSDDTIAFVWST